ncbi:prepilin peptidase [Candidatus Woesearchaeota archaeon]|nr:prepilin peptidase [Candidatus Woesearchaeota archaeon]
MNMVYDWFGSWIAPSIVAYGISFVALLAASLTDLKTREVPDWLNYGLIISGIALNLLFSVIYSTHSFIINSIVGLIIFFGIAYIMFYAGQWGGGDSKILMGLGAMIGIDLSSTSHQFLFGFFISSLFVGAIYGLLWSIWLAFKNKKKFLTAYTKISSGKNIVKIKKTMVIFLLALLFSLLFIVRTNTIRTLLLSASLLILVTFYLWIFVKAIEKSSMYKSVEPSKLTEGDWIVDDVYVEGKYITGPKELGISKSQIRKLVQFHKQKKVRKILIKEGIPFVPSFFIAFCITWVFGNPLMLLL